MKEKLGVKDFILCNSLEEAQRICRLFEDYESTGVSGWNNYGKQEGEVGLSFWEGSRTITYCSKKWFLEHKGNMRHSWEFQPENHYQIY
jgi:hypothetical protein